MSNPDVVPLIGSNITSTLSKGPCCWNIYESENFSGNYQVMYSGGTTQIDPNPNVFKPFELKLKAKSIKSIPDCNVKTYACVDPPVCTIYNEENVIDPNNPWENLIECDPITGIETIQNKTHQLDCIISTLSMSNNKILFDKCHSISPSYHVCVPSAAEKCDENDWIGKSCNGIGNIHSGKLSQYCKEGKCEFGGIVIA